MKPKAQRLSFTPYPVPRAFQEQGWVSLERVSLPLTGSWRMILTNDLFRKGTASAVPYKVGPKDHTSLPQAGVEPKRSDSHLFPMLFLAIFEEQDRPIRRAPAPPYFRAPRTACQALQAYVSM